MNVLTATKSNNTITVLVNDEGKIKQFPATSDHPKWNEIVQAWTAGKFENLLELLQLKQVVERWSKGGLSVTDQGVFYREQQLVGVDVERLMGYLRENISYDSLANYMVRKLANPSRRAINEMYAFLEHKSMPLTPEGTILAYKGVQKDFFSVSSGQEPLTSGRRNEHGQIFNGIGEIIEMERSYVDDDFLKGCSGGLHAGSLEYARNWAHEHGGIIILIEIDPAGVVSVPQDCNCSKLRCAKYKVLGLYDGQLPDTFTSDYSTPTREDTDLEDEECQRCGLSENDCQCMANIAPPSMGSPTTTTVSFDETGLKGRAPAGMSVVNLDVRQRGVAIIAEQLGIEINRITDNESFVNLGADSLDQVELAMGLEMEFNITIPDEDAEHLVTVGQTIQYIQKMVSNKPKDPQNNTYQEGYDMGLKNGIRRRTRLYKDGDEQKNVITSHPSDFIRGYNDGYRAGRKDYKKK